MRGHVDTTLHLVGLVHEHSQDSKLSTHRLATGSWGADQAILIGGVQGTEGLGLNGVEHLHALCCVELLCFWVSQCRQRQWLQIKQLRVGWILLRQNEVAERHWQQGLRIDPAIRHHSDEVLWGQRLSDWHCEVQCVLLFGTALLQHEHFVVENLLTIDILDKDPEWLCVAVNLGIPLEVRSNGQLHHQARARDGLDVGTQVQLGKLVNELVNGLAHLRKSNELTNL
mmetsp:Transcript_16957/g.39592  ORF Transcript_16957/g.39592 Transcript_16957/m.39592 type:complete len:227 (+) Transcript_16957:2487-3167(+)